jgi:2'-5' RNA ligase
METIRTFIAVNLPVGLINEVAAAQRQLRDTLSRQDLRVGWVSPANMHVTLKFLGDITREQSFAIRDLLQAQLADRSSFDLKVSGLGGFPTLKRPRVLWVGLSDESVTPGVGGRSEGETPASPDDRAETTPRASEASESTETEQKTVSAATDGEASSSEQATGEQATGEQATGEQATGEQATGEQATGEQSKDDGPTQKEEELAVGQAARALQSDSLVLLAKDIDAWLDELGFEREKRAFHPHLTLARIKQGSPRGLTSDERFEFGVCQPTEVVFYQSILKRSGAEYRAIQRFPLSRAQ